MGARIAGLPLGSLYGTVLEWHESMGKTEAIVRADAVGDSQATAFLDSGPFLPNVPVIHSWKIVSVLFVTKFVESKIRV